MDGRDKAVRAGIEANSMLYDHKTKTATQLYYLFDLARLAPNGAAVECGVYEGGSVVTWVQARWGRGVFYAVDNWASKNRARFWATMNKFGIEILSLEMNSWEAPTYIPNKVAFCFLDSDHSKAAITKDMAVWPDKIMPGGILAIHDYGIIKTGIDVKKVVDKWQAKNQWIELETVGALKAYRKPL